MSSCVLRFSSVIPENLAHLGLQQGTQKYLAHVPGLLSACPEPNVVQGSLRAKRGKLYTLPAKRCLFFFAVFDQKGIITNQQRGPTTGAVHRQNALKIASPNKLSSRE